MFNFTPFPSFESILAKGKTPFTDVNFPISSFKAAASWRHPSELKRPIRSGWSLGLDKICALDIARAVKTEGSTGAFVAVLGAFSELAIRPLSLFVHHRENEIQAVCVTLYQDGIPCDVVVDDRLPADEEGNPICCCNPETCALWPGYVQKACARVLGGYDKLDTANVSQIFSLFTGGHVIERRVDAADSVEKLWDKLLASDKIEHFMICRTRGEISVGENRDLKKVGLVPNQYYRLDEARLVNGVRLFRMYNPLGTEEWTGDFSDFDKNMTPDILDSLLHKAGKDGIFWVPFDAWIPCFESYYIGHSDPSWHSCGVPVTSSAGQTRIAVEIEVPKTTKADIIVYQAKEKAKFRFMIRRAEFPYIIVKETKAKFRSFPRYSMEDVILPAGRQLCVIEFNKESRLEENEMGVVVYAAEEGVKVTNLSYECPAVDIPFIENYSPRKCDMCGMPLNINDVTAFGKHFHDHCARCYVCGNLLDGKGSLLDGNVACPACCGSKGSSSRVPFGKKTQEDVEKVLKEIEEYSKKIQVAPPCASAPITEEVKKEAAADLKALAGLRKTKDRSFMSVVSEDVAQAIFMKADTNHDDIVDATELRQILLELGINWSSNKVIQNVQMHVVMNAIDKGAAEFALKKFTKWYSHLKMDGLENNVAFIEKLSEVFLRFDKNGNATLERAEVSAFASALIQAGLSKFDEKKLFAQIDKNKSDRIELAEFIDWYMG